MVQRRREEYGIRRMNMCSRPEELWRLQEEIERRIRESLDLRDGRSVRDIVKEMNQKVAMRALRRTRK